MAVSSAVFMSAQQTKAKPPSVAAGDELTVLLKSYELTTAEIRDILSANDRLVALGVAAISAGISYGLVADKREVFLVLPVLVMGVCAYAILNHHNVTFLGGYKRYLEMQINELIGKRALLWEHIVSQRRKWHAANIPVLAAFMVVVFGVNYISVLKVFDAFHWRIAYAHLAVVILLSGCVVPALRHKGRSATYAFELAKQLKKKIPGELSK